MSQILSSGQKVRGDVSQQDCTIEQLLGGGGQGEVYRACLAGKRVALKWYFPHAATAQQRACLETLVRKGPPNSRFLWPIEIASAEAVPGFGYIMPLREARYRGIVDLMKRRIDPTFRALVTAGFELAHSFLQLHSKGLCYRDISFGNVFLDPESGEVLICDNDNVAIDGDSVTGILGTPRFMAPEVVRGDALPSTQTDLFSLSVLLFYIFMIHHPLEGKKEIAIHSFDLPAMTKLFGTEPVFIFDPLDPSNEPVRGLHDNALQFWPIYPRFFRDLFVRAFTEGIRDPTHGRIREGEWRSATIRLRDSIFYCPHCGIENFYDGQALRNSGGDPGVCWSCRKRLQLPFRIRLGRNIVMLNHDSQLFPHHIDDQRQYDFTQPIAAVTRNPNCPEVWGLSNLSQDSWSFRTASDPRPVPVEPGLSVTLSSGTAINFGKMEGEIRV
jgi:eukaryotic-like serine/threonine-protein kinase